MEKIGLLVDIAIKSQEKGFLNDIGFSLLEDSFDCLTLDLCEHLCRNLGRDLGLAVRGMADQG